MAQTIAMQLLTMLIYAAIGFILFKMKLIRNEGVKDIGKLLIYVIAPSAIVRSYILERTAEMTRGLVISFLLATVCLVVSVVLSRVFYRGKRPIEEFGCAFSNAGFIGIPLVTSVIGDEAVCYAAAFVAQLNILQLSYGIFMMTGDKSAISVKKIATLPAVIAFIFGIIIYFMPFQLPDFFVNIFSALSGMNGPMAMFTIGAYFAQVSIKKMLTRFTAYGVSIVRLIIIPLITALALWAIPLGSSTVRLAVLILASAPVGANVAVYAQLYNRDYRTAVEEVVMSTVLSVATMPVIVGIFEKLY